MRSNRDLWILSAATVLIHAVCLTQYGWFRDELYYLACSHHLDWGYVDQPPLIAVVAWITRHLFGETLFGFRIVAAVANAGIVFLTGLLARRLGASRFGENLAAICSIFAPVYLSFGHFLSMNVFEPLLWMGMAYVAVVIFNGGDERLWLLFGALAGLSLENKHSTLFFGSAFVIGLLLTSQRRHLARPWIWIGGVVAALVFLPNMIWEVQHHFATYELLNNIAHSNKNAPVTPVSFFMGQVLLMGPLALPVWIVGVVWLLRQPRYRALGIAFIALFVEFVVMKGKVYYLAGAYPMVFAGGAIAISRTRWRVPALAGVIVSGLLLLPYAVPILPVETFITYQRAMHLEPPKTENHRMGPLPQQYADMFGWPEMAAAVARAYDTLTPAEKAKCAIFGQNYGQAGAIDHFGAQYGLPKAISGHQNYFLWGPRGATGEVMIVLDDDKETLDKLFTDVRPAGEFTHPLSMPYEHWTIHICRGPKFKMQELWPKVKKWI